MSTENALLTILLEKIKNDTLVLPTLPAIALRVRKAADDPDINLHEMADVIGKDPSLSARLIRISNSAYMGRRIKVDNLNQAVTRIGLTQLKTIATALAMEQLFVSKNDMVKELLNSEWNKTVAVTASALAILTLYMDSKRDRGLNVETMTLAGLVHNLGVLPVLTEAERHPEVFGNPTFLKQAIDHLSGRIGTKIMQDWGFGEEFITVSEKWKDMKFQPPRAHYIDFIRVGAVANDLIPSRKETVLQRALDKGIIQSVEVFDSPEYQKLRDEAKGLFA